MRSFANAFGASDLTVATFGFQTSDSLSELQLKLQPKPSPKAFTNASVKTSRLERHVSFVFFTADLRQETNCLSQKDLDQSNHQVLESSIAKAIDKQSGWVTNLCLCVCWMDQEVFIEGKSLHTNLIFCFHCQKSTTRSPSCGTSTSNHTHLMMSQAMKRCSML